MLGTYFLFPRGGDVGAAAVIGDNDIDFLAGVGS